MKSPYRFGLSFILFFIVISFFLKQAKAIPTDAPYVPVCIYCRFLTTVARSDQHQLYDEKMEAQMIVRMGKPGFYTYSPREGHEKEAICIISWNNAARCCNWQENGSLSNQFDPEVTERGTYELKEDQLISINQQATHFLLFQKSISSSKLTSLANAGISFWGSPTTSDLFAKPLLSFKNALLSQTESDPCLKSNRIGFTIGDLTNQPLSATSNFTKKDIKAMMTFIMLLGFGSSGYAVHGPWKRSIEPSEYHEKRGQSYQPSEPSQNLSWFENPDSTKSPCGIREGSLLFSPEQHYYSKTPPQYSSAFLGELLQKKISTMDLTLVFCDALSKTDVNNVQDLARNNAAALSNKVAEMKIRMEQGNKEKNNFAQNKIQQDLISLSAIIDQAEKKATFYKTLPKENTSDWEDFRKKQLEKSLDHNTACTILKEVFKDLNASQLQAILKETDALFKNDDECGSVPKKTLADFIFFVKKELERSTSYWQFCDRSNPYFNAFSYQLFNALFAALKTQTWFTEHVSPHEAMGMSYVITALGEWTSSYRQLPTEVNNAHHVEPEENSAPSTSPGSAGEFFPISLVYSLLWHIPTTIFSISRNYPGNVIHEHLSLFLGASWVMEFVTDLTRPWRQHRSTSSNQPSEHHEEINSQASFDAQVDSLFSLIDDLSERVPSHSKEHFESTKTYTPKSLFSDLDSFTQDCLDKHITHQKDQISFADIPEKLNDEHLDLYRRDIDQTALLVYKHLGIDAANRFCNRFQIKREAGNPLTVEEFQNFIAVEKEKLKESYFLFPMSSLEELANPSDKNRDSIIKSSDRKRKFHPFSEEEFFHEVDEEEKILEGINETRERIRLLFEKLTPLHCQDIIDSFDTTFTKKGKTWWRGLTDPSWKEKKLTLGECHSFIKEQEEQSLNQWNKLYYDCIANPYLCAGLWNVYAVTNTAIRVYLLPHHLLASTALVLVYRLPGDLYGRYREIPIANNNLRR